MVLQITSEVNKEYIDEKISQMLEKAEQLHTLGRYEEAEDLYREVLKLDPNNHIAYHHLGIMALQGGKFDLAKTFLKAASVLDPQNVRYLIDLATAHFCLKEINIAISILEKALEIDPDNYEIRYNLGTALMEKQEFEEASKHLDRAVVLDPYNPKPFVKLSYCLTQLGRYEEAEEIAKAAFVLRPKEIEDMFILMEVFLDINRPWYAIAIGNKLVDKDPTNISFRARLATAYQIAGIVCRAEEEARKALSLAPNMPGLYKLLASAMMVCSGWDEAMEVVEEGLKLAPENENLLLQKASILEKKGKDQEAFKIVKRFFQNREDHNPQAVSLLATLCKKFHVEEEGIELLNEVLKNKNLGQSFISSTKFILAELYDSIGEYDKAFEALKEANDLVPRTYSREKEEEFIKALKEVFTKEFFEKAPRSSIKTQKPIFIVGMPRSGTSLTEQILATHPDVFGAGELSKVGEISSFLPYWLKKNINFPWICNHLTQDVIDKAAKEYLDFIDSLSGGKFLFVTDKMPGNFVYLGLIFLMFPEAKIIHCKRNPYDTCLSNYFQNFAAAGLGYSYNLEDLGHYYRLYLDIMDHWKKVLPTKIYENEYEELVQNPKEKIKEILDFCGLSWYEGCLEFYKTKRDVKTASYDQVRKPIYKKSVARWKRYEKHLEPLKKILESEDLPGLSLKKAKIVVE